PVPHHAEALARVLAIDSRPSSGARLAVHTVQPLAPDSGAGVIPTQHTRVGGSLPVAHHPKALARVLAVNAFVARGRGFAHHPREALATNPVSRVVAAEHARVGGSVP